MHRCTMLFASYCYLILSLAPRIALTQEYGRFSYFTDNSVPGNNDTDFIWFQISSPDLNEGPVKLCGPNGDTGCLPNAECGTWLGMPNLCCGINYPVAMFDNRDYNCSNFADILVVLNPSQDGIIEAVRAMDGGSGACPEGLVAKVPPYCCPPGTDIISFSGIPEHGDEGSRCLEVKKNFKPFEEIDPTVIASNPATVVDIEPPLPTGGKYLFEITPPWLLGTVRRCAGSVNMGCAPADECGTWLGVCGVCCRVSNPSEPRYFTNCSNFADLLTNFNFLEDGIAPIKPEGGGFECPNGSTLRRTGIRECCPEDLDAIYSWEIEPYGTEHSRYNFRCVNATKYFKPFEEVEFTVKASNQGSIIRATLEPMPTTSTKSRAFRVHVNGKTFVFFIFSLFFCTVDMDVDFLVV